MSLPPIPPIDYREEFDPLLLERQRRRYASRAIAYLVLLNGVAAVVLLGSLSRLAHHVPEPRRLVDAMLVFGAGAAIALGSTFFAYVRRTVMLRAPDRIPLRVGLWWLSVLAAVVAAACFLIGLNMAGRAALPEKAAISSGAKFKGDEEGNRSRTKREGRDKDETRDEQQKAEKREEQKKDKKREDQQEEERKQGAGPQPLSRKACEEAGRAWSESTNTCD